MLPFLKGLAILLRFKSNENTEIATVEESGVISTLKGVQCRGDIMSTVEDTVSTVECSVPWRIQPFVI